MPKERFKLTKKIIGLCLLVLLAGCQSPANTNQEQEVNETKEEVIERKEITSQLTNSDLYNVNVYLSDLSSIGFKSYDKENHDHDQLLNLGFWLYAFDGMDKVDSEVVNGYYYDVFPYEEFHEKLNQYFDCQLEKKGNDEWLFQDNKYYHPLLDRGYALDTVTQVDRTFDNGDGSFLVEGSIYRFESTMEYNLYEQYVQPKSTWTVSMDSELIGTVTATIVYSENLNHYVLDDYQTKYFSSEQSLNDEEYIDTSGGKADCFDCTLRELDYYLETGEFFVVNDYRTLSEGEYNRALKTDIFNYANEPITTAGIIDYIIPDDNNPNNYTVILNIDPFSDDYPYTISLAVNKEFPQLVVGDMIEVYVVPHVYDIENSEGAVTGELEYFRFLDDYELKWMLE